MTKERIAVLGAGPMGLGVAYQLVRDGKIPVVYEADDRVGGMAAPFDFGGMNIERYYHFHCTSDDAFFDVLKELGLEDKLHWVETRMGYFFDGKAHPWGNPLALLRFPGLSFLAKFRYGLHAFLSTRRNGWKDLDGLEATGWIKRWIGEEAYDVLWKKLFDLKFYDYANQLSAAWIWSRIRRIGRSRYDIFREKLGYLDGGSDTLLQGMKAYIEANGGEVRLGSAVNKVEIRNGAVTGVEVAGEVHAFDKVISTIPLPFVPRIMPDLPSAILDKYRALKNIAVVCVIAKLRRPVTGNFWLNVNDPDMDIPGIVEYTNLRPMDHHIVYVPFYVPGEHPKYAEADEAFLDKVKRYLFRINPTLTEADIIDIRAHRYRYAQPICEPGHLEKLPAVQVPVRGLLAADTSYCYPEDRGISESIGFARRMARMI
ncbi:MAG: NAD(P)/FAD-dependent oxidoreductase [Gammaproteobacteria bacterium]|nr:NAD(P)/FAD-dependent oxidoreductase [Gammaproteobacteria bacterium]